MRFLTRLVDYRNPRALGTRYRLRRFQRFLELLGQVPRPVSILDVGGVCLFWETMGLLPGADFRIVILNRKRQAVPPGSGFESVAGDARDLRPFADGSFDVVFSNSVIEHVGGLEDQRRMAKEICRVGRRYFVQTPNYGFPLEPHFLFPGFQYLPAGARAYMLQRMPLGHYARVRDAAKARAVVTSVRLLGKSRLHELFPQAAIEPERFLFLTKSFMVLGGWDQGGSTGATPRTPAGRSALSSR